MAGSHVDVTDRRNAQEERNQSLAREREARREAEMAVRVLEEAREALRASEEQYRSLADLIPGVVWTAGPDGSINYANRFWFEYTGLSIEQTLGTGWAEVVHPDDVPRVILEWKHALQTGTPIEVDYRLRKADGSFRWFLAHAKPLHDREGRTVKWFGMLTEIEDQKLIAKALERQNAEVRLLYNTTVAAYGAATFEEALHASLNMVCAYTGRPVGHIFLRSEVDSDMVATRIWHLDHPGMFKDFLDLTERTRLRLVSAFRVVSQSPGSRRGFPIFRRMRISRESM